MKHRQNAREREAKIRACEYAIEVSKSLILFKDICSLGGKYGLA